MTNWIPVSDPPPPDDHHTWAAPEPDACPNCGCCSARLCATAKERDSFCDFLGRNADFDLSECPCAGSCRPSLKGGGQ